MSSHNHSLPLFDVSYLLTSTVNLNRKKLNEHSDADLIYANTRQT